MYAMGNRTRMNRSEREGLQHLCMEDPEFLIFYQEFQAIHARPPGEHRIVICGLRSAGKHALLDILCEHINNTSPVACAARRHPLENTVIHGNRCYLNPVNIDASPLGALGEAIGADWLLYVHSRDQAMLAPQETRFLTILRHRFPDLGRRMLIALHGNNEQPGAQPANLSALAQSLARLFPYPPPIIPISSGHLPMDSGVQPAELRRRLDNLMASYPGGLAAARVSAATSLLDSLDYFIARAIKRREQDLTTITADLDQTRALWHQDLLILNDLLSQRIAHNTMI